MKNILLPTDFSENSWNAIAYALRFFERNTCNFYLLHVNSITNLATGDMPNLAVHENIEKAYLKTSKKELRTLLKRISLEFPPNKKHKIYTITDYNFFVESIRKQVKEKKIDLIVMGTKGASGLSEYIIGTNTGDIITKVKCTTLAVPEKATYKSIQEVAFPTSFVLPFNIKTLQPISTILEKKAASLRILHIHKKDEQLNSEQQQNKELIDDFFEENNHSFHFLTNKKVEDAIECFVQSRNIDMMVMVAKNLNYFQQILFHSKVEKISYHTNIPFLVLHE